MPRYTFPALICIAALVSGCWWSKRGDFGLGGAPASRETYVVTGTVVAFGHVKLPASGARVTAYYHGAPATATPWDTATWTVPDARSNGGNAQRRGVDVGGVTASLPHALELGTAVTDSSGRFSINVDRRPPPGTTWSTFVVGPVSMSASRELVIHNHLARAKHAHWVVELRIEKEGYEPARVYVRVPGKVTNGAAPVLPARTIEIGEVDSLAERSMRPEVTVPQADRLEVLLLPNEGRSPPARTAGRLP